MVIDETTTLEVKKTKLDGVLLITPPTNFEDHRGAYVELYNDALYHEAGITTPFIQDSMSISTQHVLRGLHGNSQTWKLVSCLYGRFYLVVVNYDETHPQFKQWEAFTLSDSNRLQVLIPPNFGNGHLALSDKVIFHYKQSTHYDRDSQFTLMWNDPELNIWWPIKNPILSMRDEELA